jgi:hypothetical protein
MFDCRSWIWYWPGLPDTGFLWVTIPYPHPIIGNITLENVTANNNGYKFESSKETKEDANGANLKTNGNLTLRQRVQWQL